jgi:hypothetical protein
MVLTLKLFRTRKNPVLLMVLGLASCILLFSACSDSGDGKDGSSNPSEADTGALSFKLALRPQTNKHGLSRTAVLDCVANGVEKIEALVYNPDNAFLSGGGPWDCAAGKGSVAGIPAGNNRTIVILGKNDSGHVVIRGQKEGVDIVANQESSAGVIDCYTFVSSLKAPTDGMTAFAGALNLEWNDVAGATGYHLVVSNNSELEDPIINDHFTTSSFAPSGLSSATTYYWKVIAQDANHNRGAESATWSFTLRENEENTPPKAQISRPEPFSTFTTSDDIVFTGNGIDAEDGDLNSASCVWTSDVDGRIGEGESVATDTLSAGKHQITLTVADSIGATGMESVVVIIATGRLPDTGQIEFYTETTGQDSDYKINPPTYTKLDAAGTALDPGAAIWAMVRDDVTNLIWEVKTDDDTIHNKNHRYVLEDVQEKFIAQLNNNNFGGRSDWRLPTIKELYSILNNGDAEFKIDTAYFPNTTFKDYSYMKDGAYLSSTERAETPDTYWKVEFLYGQVSLTGFPPEGFVRAVCGGKNESTKINNGDGTVTDLGTGLMWQQVNAEAVAVSWEAALDYCETLVRAGRGDWRLPNTKELQSIVDYETKDPAINTAFFPNTKPDATAGSIYWTSTTQTMNSNYAWTVHFYHGGIFRENKTEQHYVRCLRGGQ